MSSSSSSLSESTEERCLSRFKAAALRFYMRGDIDAQAMLLEFEESNLSESATVIIESSPLSVDCGLSLLAHKPSLRSAFVNAKDDARREAHGLLLTERRALLKKALADADIDDELPTSWERLKRSVAGLRTFSAKYRGNVAAQPLLRGAIAFLIETQRSPCVVTWVVDGAVFTESGGKAYVDDVVRLLRELPLLRADLRKFPDEISLELDQSWSDANLERLIRSAKNYQSDAEDHAKPTGRFLRRHDALRSNADGSQDEKGLCIDALCLDLGLLF